MKKKISLAQINIQFAQPDQNLKKAMIWIEQAAALKSDCVLLPELWTSGYDLPHAAQYPIQNQEIIAELQKAAVRHQIYIGGSYLLTGSGGVQNTFVFLNPDGSSPATYAKIHLFGKMDEDIYLNTGTGLTISNFSEVNTGFAICYDLRFPEIFRKYVLSGANLILLSAEWPTRRISHWDTLLQARAIENQSFVAAVNCVGQTGSDTFGGCSAIIGPRGEMLTQGNSTDEALLTAEIDLDKIQSARSWMHVLDDRRPDIYGNLD
jgi:omega-amidase